MTSLKRKISELQPWRYDHENGNAKIEGDDDIREIEKKFNSRHELVQIILSIKNIGNLSKLRVLDLGCLEGHYTAEIAKLGVKEVVGVDISNDHLKRARFLLNEFHKFNNAKLVKCAATDIKTIRSLGKFDVVLCHGLLYHLKDPLLLFDLFEEIIPKGKPFTILLNTQFKGNFFNLISPLPVAEIQLKQNFDPAKAVDNKYIYSNKDESVFERISMRLNPIAVFKTLEQYQYNVTIGLDTPRGIRFGYSINLMCQKHSSFTDAEIEKIFDKNKLKLARVRATKWEGRSVDGFDFNNGLFWNLWRRISLNSHRILHIITVRRLMRARKAADR